MTKIAQTKTKSVAITYCSNLYNENVQYDRYVRVDKMTPDQYWWCEVNPNDTRYDVRQGTVSGSDLPEDIKHNADSVTTWPPYIKWPY